MGSTTVLAAIYIKRREMLVKVFKEKGAISKNTAYPFKDEDFQHTGVGVLKIGVKDLNREKIFIKLKDSDKWYLDVSKYEHVSSTQKMIVVIFLALISLPLLFILYLSLKY